MTERIDVLGTMVRVAVLSEQDEKGEWVVRTRNVRCSRCHSGYKEAVKDPLTSCPYCNSAVTPEPAEPVDMQQARGAMRDMCGKLKDALEDK